MNCIDSTMGKNWALYRGDCVDVLPGLPESSVDYAIFSPPFASLYTYSASPRDMGNCRTDTEFFDQFAFLIKELRRIVKPGHNVSFHCMQLPTSKVRDGVIGLKDFRGELIRAFCGSEAATLHEAKRILQRLGRDCTEIDAALADASLRNGGFIYASEVCIWKDPVTAMQRTKALGLLHKTVRNNATMSRQGIADYLVTMRAPGDVVDKVAHGDEIPVEEWQKLASPIWTDINPNDTLQYRSAREHDDERHICPLQLEVIRRGIRLWTNPGDVVLSPFAGIGSELYVARELGRRAVGVELKGSYYEQAVKNLQAASAQSGLFEAAA